MSNNDVTQKAPAILTPAEVQALNQYQEQWKMQHSVVDALSYVILGLTGVHCISDFLPDDDEDEQSIENSGLILFEHLDPLYIKAIVDQILVIAPHYKKFKTLSISITQKALQGLDLGPKLPEWVESNDKNATYWRNNITPDTMMLCAISIGENEDTLSNITRRISLDSLKQQLANKDNLIKIIAYLGEHMPEQISALNAHVQHYTRGVPRAIDHLISSSQLPGDLATVLSAIIDTMIVNPHDLCKYVANVLLILAQDDHTSLHQAIGQSLPIFEVPREQNLFLLNSKNAFTTKKISSLLNNTLDARPSLFNYSSVVGQDIEEFNQKQLQNNLSRLLTAIIPANTSADKPTYQSTANLDAKEVPLLSDWEAALIKSFVYEESERKSLFPHLCTIEWQGKLELLFSKDPQDIKKKSLYERTMEMFKNNLTNEAKLSEEEEIIIDLVKKKKNSLNREQRNSLNDLYQSRRYIFDQEPTISRDWEQYIYYENIYDDPNFLLSLVKAILYLARSIDEDSDEKLTHLTIKLKGTNQQLLNEKNYAVMSYFSLRYGAFLRDLTQRLSGILEVDYDGSASTSQAIAADAKLNPLFNYQQFFDAHNTSEKTGSKRGIGSKSTRKDDTTINLELIPTYRKINSQGTTEKGKPFKISWQLNPERISAMLTADLKSLMQGPALRFGLFDHNDANDQGMIQDISLYHASTIVLSEPTLFSTKESSNYDLSVLWEKNLTELKQRYTAETSTLSELFNDFKERYQQYLRHLQDCVANYAEIKELNASYEALQYQILACSQIQQSDHLKPLLALTLMVGMAYRKNAKSSIDSYAIATPFTVEALRSHACKLERVSELIQRVLTKPFSINDRKVFLSSLEQDLNYYDSPELCLSKEPATEELIATQFLGGYTLYVSPKKLERDMKQSLSQAVGKSSVGRKKATTDTNGAQGGGGCSGIGGANASSNSSSATLDALSTQIGEYLDRNPYPLTQCTLLFSQCPAPSFALELYRMLKRKQLESWSNTRFNLVIVCQNMRLAQDIFELLECERLSKKQTLGGSEFVKAISVSIVQADSSNPLNFSTLNSYLERMSLQQSAINTNACSDAVSAFGAGFSTYPGSESSFGNEADYNKANERFAQIGLMVHAFDTESEFKFTAPYQVPLVTDEVHYQPSLINMLDNHLGQGSVAMGRFVVTPVLPLSKILWQHSIYYLSHSEHDYKAFNNAQAQIKSSLDHQKTVATIATPLYVRTLDLYDGNNETKLLRNTVNNIHQSCDTVFYLDDMIDRSSLKKLDVRVLYYHKLPRNSLNFIIATKVNVEAKTRQFLQELVADTNLSLEDQASCINQVAEASLNISGRLLMLAQQRRNRASELMGVVLTRFVGQSMMDTIKDKYGSILQADPTFVYLDNYRAIFKEVGSQRKKCLSDLLGIQVLTYQEANKTRYLIHLMVLESKFTKNATSNTLKISLEQTRETTELLYRAFKLYASHNSLDRKQWLARIADMLVDNRDQYDHSVWTDYSKLDEFSQLQQLIREGQVDILLQGCSVVFDRHLEDDYHATTPPRCSANITPQLDKSSPEQGFPLLQIKFTGSGVNDVLTSFYQYHGTGNAEALCEFTNHDDIIKTYCFTQDDPFLLKANLLSDEQFNEEKSSPNSTPNNEHKEHSKPTDDSQQSTTNTGQFTHDFKHIVQDDDSDLDPTSKTLIDANIPTQPVTPKTEVKTKTTQEVMTDTPQVQPQPPVKPEPSEPPVVPQPPLKPQVEPEVLAPERSKWLATVPRLSYNEWRPPVSELLPRSQYDPEVNQRKLEEMANKIDDLLLEYGVNAKVDRNCSVQGPVITRFMLHLGYGETTKHIENYKDEMPRKLGVDSVHLTTGNIVSLEVPNNNRQIINLGDVLVSPEFTQSHAILPLALGLAPDGTPVVCDLVNGGPHLLVAGTTGSGKSVGLNAILLSLIAKHSPQELRLIIIDPKREFQAYEKLPHMLVPPIKDVTEDAIRALRWCIKEMNHRYDLFNDVIQTSSLQVYNDYIKKEHADGNLIQNYFNKKVVEYCEPLPRIVVLIDEFNDLMAQNRSSGRSKSSEFENLVEQLAGKCRAAGIHLILATQSPRANVVTGLIKSNLPARIAFQVSDYRESQIILDETGAEDLLSKGDMLYRFSNDSTHRAHGAYVTEQNIKSMIDAWHQHYGDPEYVSQLCDNEDLITPAKLEQLVEQAKKLIAAASGQRLSERDLRHRLEIKNTLIMQKLMAKLTEQGLF